ncbi:MAG TPA: hypothetical protein VF622_19490 [Segetibacter sp.]|jgi:hypothetical protein
MRKLFLILLTFTLSTLSVIGQTTKKKTSTTKKVSVKYSEEKASELVEDNYAFYDANNVYRNAKVRRVSNNVFYVSLEECSKDFAEKGDFFWHSKVYVLTIASNTRYRFKEKLNF